MTGSAQRIRTRSLATQLFWPLVSLGAAIGVATSTRAGSSMHAFSLVAGLASTGVLAFLPGAATLAAVERHRDIGGATALACIASGAGVAALVTFGAWSLSPGFGELASIFILIASAIVAASGRPELLGRYQLRLPVALAFLIGIAYLALGFVGGNLDDGVAGYAQRFGWPVDSSLPLILAQHVAAHLSTHAALIPGWQNSDRPPLQTGFLLFQYRLMGNPQLGYQLLGTALQMSWLPALWVLLLAKRFTKTTLIVAVIATAANPFVVQNSLYVWPKMLAGAFLLVGLAVLISDEQARLDLERGLLVGSCTALALLSHGGAMFSVIALIPIAVLWGTIAWRGLLTAAATAFFLYIPWLGYQHFLDPPGDRVLKWNLAGVEQIDRRSFFKTLADQYRSHSLATLLSNKWKNVTTLIYLPRASWNAQQTGVLAISLGPLLAGVFALRARFRAKLPGAGVLLAFVAISALVWVLLLWGSLSDATVTWLTLGPYAAIIVAIALCAVGVTTFAPVTQWMIFGAAAAWLGSNWWGQTALRDWQLIILGALAIGMIGFLAVMGTRSEQHPSGARKSLRSRRVPRHGRRIQSSAIGPRRPASQPTDRTMT